MAEVPFPSGAEIAALHIEPWIPGQLALASPFTGSIQVLNRGYASWRGTMEIAVTDDEAVAHAIEAFFAALGGQANWTALPLHRPTVAVGAWSAVTAVVNATDGTIRHTLLAALPTAVGHWLAVGDRRYTVRALNADKTEIALDPQMPLPAGIAITRATTIRARAQAAKGHPTRRTPDFWGPWQFDWQEHL